MSLTSVFVKVALIVVISWNLTPLPIVLSDSKIDKKRRPFPSCRYKSQFIKKGTLFNFLQKKLSLVNATPFFDFAEEFSFTEKLS